MPITEYCNPDVVCCEANASIAEVAVLMRKHHIGDVVVIGGPEQGRAPIGIVTDRDIVVEAVAPQVDLNMLTAGDIMTTPLATIRTDAGLMETLGYMERLKVRRLPVVRADGSLFGIVTADDVIGLLVNELSTITGVLVKQPAAEAHIRH